MGSTFLALADVAGCRSSGAAGVEYLPRHRALRSNDFTARRSGRRLWRGRRRPRRAHPDLRPKRRSAASIRPEIPDDATLADRPSRAAPASIIAKAAADSRIPPAAFTDRGAVPVQQGDMLHSSPPVG